MQLFQKMLSSQTVMFLYLLAGFVLVKLRLLKPEGRAGFVALLINVTLPCLILNSFEQDVTMQQLINAAHALLISTGSLLASYGIGRVLWRKRPQETKAVLSFATMFSNQGYAGIAIISMVFGAEAVFYTSFFLIPIRIFMWTLGISLFMKQDGRLNLKSLLLNPSLLAVVIGIPLLLTPMHLPGPLSTAVDTLGSMTAPLSMVIIGATLANIRARDVINRDVLAFSAVRLVLLPLLTLLVLRVLRAPLVLTQVQTVLMGMPAASNTAILAEMYGSDNTFAAKCIFVSTILSLFTVPCLTLLL